jgi:hypothetical protein
MLSAIRLSLLLLALGALALPSSTSLAQTPNVSREQMWFAPTREDWEKPCLIHWERTYEDAVAVARASGKALLVCVNMDGEIASEHYAGVRYRRPETAVHYAPYVCVIASVYRHTPRDYDEEGKRIPCPRFGGVTCGEHIAIEPLLYEKFMDGRRVAPRHIGVELDSSEMYDVYYALDTDTIFQKLQQGIAERPAPPPEIEDVRPLEQRLASPGAAQRERVERAYVAGDRDARKRLLEAALAEGERAPVDLLRLAIFGYDLELAALARRALAGTKSEAGIELIGAALRVPLDTAERAALVDVLARLGETSPRAQTLASVHRGLSTRSATLDGESWAAALASHSRAEYHAANERERVEGLLENRANSVAAEPASVESCLAFAEQCLSLAADPQTPRKYARLLAEDAALSAAEAERLGASGWRLAGVQALSAWHRGNVAEAQSKAELAVQGLPADAGGWNSMAILALFVSARQGAITQALGAKQRFEPQWLSDVHAAYAILARHPFGTDAHVASHVDFLRTLGAGGQAVEALQQGSARFPSSWALHQRRRDIALAERGVRGLESLYDAELAAAAPPTDIEWYAGYGALVAAETRRRANQPLEAAADYQRALALYDAATARRADCKATSDHYAAIALAGLARLALEAGDLESAVQRIEAAFARHRPAANALDGLILSGVDTAKMLRVRAEEAGKSEFVARVQSALDALEPEQLELPAFERAVPPADAGRGQRRGNRGAAAGGR